MIIHRKDAKVAEVNKISYFNVPILKNEIKRIVNNL